MKFVGYVRVSTTKQGTSGLGLAAQQQAIENHVASKNGQLVSMFIEVESGKNDNRPQLQRALLECSKIDAVLIVGKLDRLSRNMTFISQMIDSKIEFVCCDLPNANNFTIHIFAALAQQEREYISTRTKEGLAQAKKRGVKLGCPENLTQEARLKGTLATRAKAVANVANQTATALIIELVKTGLTLRAIADRLNNAGFVTSTGKSFQANTVKRLIDRAKA